MAAPEGIVWGSIAGDYVRLGIYKKISNTDTKTTVTVDLWVWTKYSMDEDYNTLYYDNLASSGSATTDRGSVSIQTSVDSGSGWSTSNQVKVKTYTHTYTRGTSAVTRYIYAKIKDVIRAGANKTSGTISASTTFSVPKLASYTVSYNANGGTGAPSAQTKYYGKDLTLSSAKPTRTGYSFQGWSTANDSSAEYAAGATYSANSGVTLYAVWKANTYSVKYNANGGAGAPSAQTKTYGVTLKLSTIIPTRENYNFLGWATSASATTPQYTAGANYTNNSGTTLYAVWELAYVRPRITGLSAFRVSPTTDEEGNTQWQTDESGTYAGVIFDYACDQAVSSIVVEWGSPNTEIQSMTIPSDGLSDSVSVVIGGDISTDATYTITVTVTDASGYSEVYTTLPGTKFAIDVKAECKGIAFGKPAELDGVADFGYTIKPSEGFINIPIPENTNFDDLRIPNTYVSYDKVASTYLNCPITSGTFTLEVSNGGNEGQVRQRVQYCSKDASIIYERFYHSGSWGVWYEAGGLKSAITVGLTANSTVGVVNSYTQIPFNNSIIKLSRGLSLKDGAVVVGAGVRYVRIGAQTKITCGTVAGNRHVRLCKNRNGTISYIGWLTMKTEASAQEVLTFTSTIVSVSEGDSLYMVFYTPDSTDYHVAGTSGNGWQTYMTVESL